MRHDTGVPRRGYALRRNSVICGSSRSRISRVGDAETLFGREHQHAELAFVHVLVHLRHRVGDLLEREHRREHRMDLAFAHQPVGFPRLAVVGEVATLERLQVHPEVAVVVLDHEAGGRRAGDDGAAPRAHEHRRAHRGAPGVLEHDVGVAAGELADALAEPPPLRRVLRVLVGPELEAFGLAVDHVLDPEVVQHRRTRGVRHDGDGSAAAVEHVLARVGADAAARAPDQDRLALRHLRRSGSRSSGSSWSW